MDPPRLFVLWAIKVKFCISLDDFHNHYSTDFPVDNIVDSLIQDELLRQNSGELVLTETGEQAIAYLGNIELSPYIASQDDQEITDEESAETNASQKDERTVLDLLTRCAKRPVDEAAWSEFMTEFHPLIKATVSKTYRSKAWEGGDIRSHAYEDQMEDLVQRVYIKLIEDDSRALANFLGEHANSIYQYLQMISINVVRDHYRGKKAKKRPKIVSSIDELMETSSEGAAVRSIVTDINGRVVKESNAPVTIDEAEAFLKRNMKGKNRHRDLMIFQLRYREDLTLEEISQLLDSRLTAISVGSILKRTADKLKPLFRKIGHK